MWGILYYIPLFVLLVHTSHLKHLISSYWFTGFVLQGSSLAWPVFQMCQVQSLTGGKSICSQGWYIVVHRMPRQWLFLKMQQLQENHHARLVWGQLNPTHWENSAIALRRVSGREACSKQMDWCPLKGQNDRRGQSSHRQTQKTWQAKAALFIGTETGRRGQR